MSVRHIVPSCEKTADYDGEPAVWPTAIGKVTALASGLVRDDIDDGPVFILNDAETTEALKAFLHASTAADRAGKARSGYNTVRVDKTSQGEVRATYRRDTRAMRLMRFRGKLGRDCMVCRARQLESIWVARYTRPGCWAEVCQACVDRLSRAPEGLRDVGGGGR